MKTLKKTLCLVLAMVMVFGLCVTSASAKLDSYADEDTITYDEAVDVMTGIGVLNGDNRDGAQKFRPKDSISRAEAAKIIAYIMIGDSAQADALKAGTDPFSDVSTYHWAAGYISYCATAGIIGGMGDGSYHPDDNVTGLAFAKMLLCALGYGVNDEYTGADWAINVSREALRLGIFDGNTAGANNNAATREECALYAFNVIHGTEDYTGVAKVSYSALLGGYIEWGSVNATAADSNKGPIFGDDFKLIKNEETDDYFGRLSGHMWYVKNRSNPISALYPDSDDLKGEYYSKVTMGEVADVLGDAFIKDVKDNSLGHYSVWINGVENKGIAANNRINLDKLTKSNKTNLFDETVPNGANTTNVTKTANGVETLVYAGVKYSDTLNNGNGGWYSWLRIVIVDTYLAKVTSVDKDNNAVISLLKDRNNADIHVALAKDGNKINAEGLSRNDYVIVNIDDSEDTNGVGAVRYIEKAPTVSNVVSRFQKADGIVTFTVSGTEYRSAKTAAADPVTKLLAANDTNLTATTMVNGKNHVLYLDGHGYALAVADVDDTSDYVFVSHFGRIDGTGDFDTHALGAKVYYVDGTSKVLTVNTDTTLKDSDNQPNLFGKTDTSLAACIANETKFNQENAGIYRLTMKEGKALLTGTSRVPHDNSDDTDPTQSAPIPDTATNPGIANKQVKKSISTIVNGRNNRSDNQHACLVKADGDTVFYYVYGDPATEWNKSFFKVTPYVGIANVRSSKDNNATVEKYIENKTFADAYIKDANGVDTTAVNPKNQIADAVWVRDGEKAKTDDTVYLFTGSYDDKDKSGNESTTVTYDVYVDGELTTLVISYKDYDEKDAAIAEFNEYVNAFFTLDSDKLPTATTLVEDGASKEISDYCYESKLLITRTDVASDPFTFWLDASISANGKRFAYDKANVIYLVDNSNNDKAEIGSVIELDAALKTPCELGNWQSINNIRVSVQYADDSANSVRNVYIVSMGTCTPKP